MAYGIASCNGSEVCALGIHKGDHHIYPDCREDFFVSLNESLRLATRGHRHEDLRLEAPFLNESKTEIARQGAKLGVRYDLTWTCYNGEEKHCGLCGACQERKESFKDSNTVDPTEYAA
jgi:7-cyano-7-deazaguanine synthase